MCSRRNRAKSAAHTHGMRWTFRTVESSNWDKCCILTPLIEIWENVPFTAKLQRVYSHQAVIGRPLAIPEQLNVRIDSSASFVAHNYLKYWVSAPPGRPSNKAQSQQHERHLPQYCNIHCTDISYTTKLWPRSQIIFPLMRNFFNNRSTGTVFGLRATKQDHQFSEISPNAASAKTQR